MLTTSKRRFPWRQTLKDVATGFLQAVGILPLKGIPKGAYWARKESTGQWELRVPATTWDHPPA